MYENCANECAMRNNVRCVNAHVTSRVAFMYPHGFEMRIRIAKKHNAVYKISYPLIRQNENNS